MTVLTLLSSILMKKAQKAAESLSKEGQEAVAFRADVSDRENVLM